MSYVSPALRVFMLAALLLPVSVATVLCSESLEDLTQGLQIAGGIATAGFGIWHYFIPGMYGWWPYFDDDPDELKKGVEATNFFFSTSLVILGGLSVALPLVLDMTDTANILLQWSMVALWTSRAVYQVVSPQGTQIPLMAPAMVVGFLVTDLLFLMPAVVSTSSLGR